MIGAKAERKIAVEVREGTRSEILWRDETSSVRTSAQETVLSGSVVTAACECGRRQAAPGVASDSVDARILQEAVFIARNFDDDDAIPFTSHRTTT